MKRIHDLKNDEELNEASWVAVRGGVAGAAKWGLYTAAVCTAAYFYTPIYRNLTVQFKVFIQMSGMTLGGMVEADRRLRVHEALVRRNKRMQKEAAVWRAYESEFERRGTPGVGSEAGVHRTEGGDEEVVR